MSKKPIYRISNWSSYNQALVNRGNLTLWFDSEAIDAWNKIEPSGKRGRPNRYSAIAIETSLSLRAIFRLPLRATEGLVLSLIRMLNLPLQAPDYTTLCRRQRTLAVALPVIERSEAVHVVIDATGLKIYGEGEWKVRQHGYSKRRTWRKLHLAVDESSGEVLASAFTGADGGDGEQLPDLLELIDQEIEQVSADGAYDSWENHEAIAKRKAKVAIPPRRGSKIKQHGNSNKPPLPRDEAVRCIRKMGRKRWKENAGYHRRSLAETAVFRIKTLFGRQLNSRIFEHQATETFIRCAVLNRFSHLGMPDSYAVNI